MSKGKRLRLRQAQPTFIDFASGIFNECVIEALRGTTYWSKAEAELLGAFAFEIPNAASYRRLGFTLYNMGYGLAVLPG